MIRDVCVLLIESTLDDSVRSNPTFHSKLEVANRISLSWRLGTTIGSDLYIIRRLAQCAASVTSSKSTTFFVTFLLPFTRTSASTPTNTVLSQKDSALQSLEQVLGPFRAHRSPHF